MEYLQQDIIYSWMHSAKINKAAQNESGFVKEKLPPLKDYLNTG